MLRFLINLLPTFNALSNYMKRFILLLFCACFISSLWAQSQINGKITDKADNKPLTNASIILLDQDSILKYFTRADENGNFTFKKVNNSIYTLLVTYPKFELYSQKINLDKNLNVNTISLSSRANLIEEVVIKQNLPIKLKGDTLEYNAASFETEKNAKLEDLLRRLPGLTVSGDGEITAQGKSVSKVLIDGEEFFGYDPKIAIRNVRADAVDKVQVYERKSQEAELTGIDDGKRFQTINVVLKEEARKGIFGNAEALGGTSQLYAGNLFAAKFNRTERVGITANTNNMGGSSGREGDLRTNSRIVGNPKNTSLGANYENQFLNKKLTVNGNYNFNHGSNSNERENFNKEIISKTEIQETNTKSENANSNQGHIFNSRFKYKVDSTSNLDIEINARTTKTTSQSSSSSNVFDGNGNPIRDFISKNSGKGENKNADIRFNYRKRLNSNGRSLNLHFSNGAVSANQQSQVDQNTYFYKQNDTTTINQTRLTNNNSNSLTSQLQFTDRIGSKIYYTLGYRITNNTETDKTDAINNSTESAELDLTYSKNQKNNNLNQGIITNIGINTEKYNVNFSNRTDHKNQKLIDTYRDINLDRQFWDNDFNASINYRLSNRKNINLAYQNNFDIPSFGQLQPLQPQTNPIFRQDGNPNLKKAMNNSLRLNYNTISLLKGTSWNINSNIAIKTDPIINKRTISDTLTISTFENIKGKSSWNASLNSNYSKPIMRQRIQLNIFSSANYGNGFSFIKYIPENGDPKLAQYQLANTQNTTITTGLRVNEQNTQGIDFDISWNISANNQRNNLQPDLDYTNLNTRANGFIKYFLPKQANITLNTVYSVEGPTKLYKKSIQQFYTNIALEKKLLKSQNLMASIKCYDIFNSYNTVSRTNSDTNYSESSQMVLTRYILLGLKWDFNKNLGKKNND